MPTYEYGCESCGARFELEQRITEAPIKQCVKCGADGAKRLISGGNFMLKGSGWYADGYSGSSNKSAPAESAATPAPASPAPEPKKSAATSSD